MACHSSHFTGVTVGRAPAYAKRGGGAPHLDLEEVAVVSPDRGTDIVALDEALTSLAALSPRQSQVVELRFFGGLSLEETAEVLKVSIGTVRRDWSLARAWLHRAVTSN
jgi:RNA polymerase sigma-70 factor (ECF subfamily)